MTDAPAELPRIAYLLTEGEGPTIVFLPGYASDMTGSKATAIEAWAREKGYPCLRFDYSGCGASEGDFEDGTLASWRDDALHLIDTVVQGPVILVGSSMGGWIMLLIARARPDRVAGMVGIAAAPDFTDWGFSTEEKMTLLQTGRLERKSPYWDEPIVTTRAFWSSGEAHRVLIKDIQSQAPTRLIHGMADAEVPWQYSVRVAERLRSSDVQTLLIKDGDHRLSRDDNIALILRTIEEVRTRCCLPPS